MNEFFIRKNTVGHSRASEFFIVFAIIVSALVLHHVSTYCEINRTFDSNLYLEMSKAIQHIGFFEAIKMQAFNSKPPFYPLLLSLVSVANMAYFNSMCL